MFPGNGWSPPVRFDCVPSFPMPRIGTARTKGLFRVNSRLFCRMSNRFDTMSDDFDRIVDAVDSVDYLDIQIISGNHFETFAGC